MAKKDRHVAPETVGTFNLAPPSTPNITQEQREKMSKGEDVDLSFEMAQVVNVELTNTTVDVPVALGLSSYTIRPFDISPPMRTEWIENITRHSMARMNTPASQRRIGDTGKPTLMVLAPSEPPNFKKKEWKDPNSGRVYQINTYRPKQGVLRPDGRQMYHSEEQAFFVVSKMLTTEAIQRYIRDFDNRPNVVNFAHTVINYRQEQQLQRSGVTQRISRAVN